MAHSEQRPPEIVVGLVATPPDYPARVAARLTAELAGQLAGRVDADVRWTVREGWGEVAPRRDGGVEALLDDLARRRADARWDVAICLTDLPLHAERVPLVAQASARRRVAMVSLPALGLRQLRAVRVAVPDLVGRLLTDASDERVPPAGWAPAELASRVAAIRRVVGGADAGELGYVASRLIGRLRLLTGMVRANRPGRALLGLSKLLVGAFGTAAFALTTNTIWQMGDALGGLRLAVIMLLGLTALVAWLIVAHDLWEKPDRETPAELARLFNLGTVLTLTLATAVSYLVLFAGTVLAAALLIDTSVLEQTLQRPVDFTDYLILAWIISSLATVGGAIGSGLEDEDTVRAAAYGYHPEPSGWRDENDAQSHRGAGKQARPSRDRTAGVGRRVCAAAPASPPGPVSRDSLPTPAAWREAAIARRSALAAACGAGAAYRCGALGAGAAPFTTLRPKPDSHTDRRRRPQARTKPDLRGRCAPHQAVTPKVPPSHLMRLGVKGRRFTSRRPDRSLRHESPGRSRFHPVWAVRALDRSDLLRLRP